MPKESKYTAVHFSIKNETQDYSSLTPFPRTFIFKGNAKNRRNPPSWPFPGLSAIIATTNPPSFFLFPFYCFSPTIN